MVSSVWLNGKEILGFFHSAITSNSGARNVLAAEFKDRLMLNIRLEISVNELMSKHLKLFTDNEPLPTPPQSILEKANCLGFLIIC
jgi:hypothetical protein